MSDDPTGHRGRRAPCSPDRCGGVVPELLPDFARLVEGSGFDELWVVEDCSYASAVPTALSRRIAVGAQRLSVCGVLVLGVHEAAVKSSSGCVDYANPCGLTAIRAYRPGKWDRPVDEDATVGRAG